MLHVPFFSEKLSFFFSGKCRQFSKKRQFFSGLCMGISGPRYATLVKEGSPHFHIRSPKYSISHRARCRCMAYGELIFLVLSSFHPSNNRGQHWLAKRVLADGDFVEVQTSRLQRNQRTAPPTRRAGARQYALVFQPRPPGCERV